MTALRLAGIFFVLFHAVNTLAIEGIPFFRTPQSLFPSGHSNPERLLKNESGTDFIFEYLLQDGKRSQWVKAEDIARDLDLSQLVTFQNQDHRVIEIRGYWTALERLSDKKRQWAPLTDLEPSLYDIGKALTLISTTLRKLPNWRSDAVLTLPSRTSLKILQIQDTWIKVEFEGASGWLDANNVILKADFATEILTPQNVWKKVSYREGFQVKTTDDNFYSLAEVRGFKTDHNRGISLISDEKKNLLIRKQCQILKTDAQIWTRSQVPGHGLVYWQKSKLSRALHDEPDNLSAKEMLQRPIFSVSFDPKNPNLAVASSHGIYITDNAGETWRKVRQFKQEDHPVQISPQGEWFVGFLRSLDQGKTFTQYMRSDELARLVQSQFHSAPRILKLSGIEFKNSKLQLRVEAGSKVMRISSRISASADWRPQWDFLD